MKVIIFIVIMFLLSSCYVEKSSTQVDYERYQRAIIGEYQYRVYGIDNVYRYQLYTIKKDY
jgi:hypothetical protein